MKYKLTRPEKLEMVKDAHNEARRVDFRNVRGLSGKMTFEEYVHWLSQITRHFPEKQKRKFVPYSKILI